MTKRTKHKGLKLLSVICFFLHFLASAEELQNSSFELKPFVSKYTAFRHGSDIGVASLSLTAGPQKSYQLEYKSEVSRFFFSDNRNEKTIYQLTDSNNLTPVTYEYKRTGTGPNKELTIEFDRLNKKATIGDNKKVDIVEHVDNQLFRIDISRQLAEGHTEFSYDFINYRGEMRSYKILAQMTEQLSLPFGTVNAIKVKVARESNKRVTYAWFAPTLNYSLVRLQQFKENKEQGDIQLASFTLSN